MPVFADEREMKRNVRNAWMKTRYNVHELYKETGCAQRIARHPYFENSVLVPRGRTYRYIYIYMKLE